MFAPHRRRSPRGLRFEQLENRSLLAFGAFAVNLYEDVGGTPGQIIASDTVHAGDSFFVEITAEDLLAEPRGLGGVHLRMAWNPQVLREIDAEFDPSKLVTSKLPVFQLGTLDQNAGRIDDLGGGAAVAWGVGNPIGRDGPERFALLHFQALDAPGSSPFAIGSGSHGISHFPPVWGAAGNFTFEKQTITVVAAANAQSVEALTTVAKQVISLPVASSATAETPVTSKPINDTSDGPLIAEILLSENIASPPADATVHVHVDEPAGELIELDPPASVDAPAGESGQVRLADSPHPTEATSTDSPAVESHPTNAAAVTKITTLDPPATNVCVFIPNHFTLVARTPRPPTVSDEPQIGNRWTSFIGPLPPEEYATRLILSNPAHLRASHAIPHQLDERLADLLATDVISALGRLMP